MNFSFYIYGTPNGYNQYPDDSVSATLQGFVQHNSTESQLSVYRKGPLVHYAYMRRLDEKSNNFLGFCIVLNGVSCQIPKKLFSLFDSAFDDVLMKGELLKFEKGKCLFTVNKFIEKQSEIDRIRAFFKNKLENDLTRDFAALSTSVKIGNGSKNISIKDSESEIIAAIAEFDCVHISNNEKSLSELERTHKLLTDLYAEKQKLYGDYRKLIAQKKQYNVVFALLIAVIACGIGLFAFNKNLQSKDSQIQTLNKNVNQQQNYIKNLNLNVAQLETENEKLSSEKSRLTSEVKQISEKNIRLSSENSQLDSENSNLKSTVNSLESQNNSYKSENQNYRSENQSLSQKNRNLESEIITMKKQMPVSYNTISDAYFYYRKSCNKSYESTSCYTSKGKTVQVYKIDNGYGLTEYGWVMMSRLD